MTTRPAFLRGDVSCGCSGGYNWNESQNICRVTRVAAAAGYDFRGWVGSYAAGSTYLKLYNPVTRNYWETTTLNKFVNAGRRDPTTSVTRVATLNRATDESHIAKFPDRYTEYKRNNTKCNSKGYLDFWDYFCPSCSSDIYVHLGLCDGVFTSSTCSLKGGVTNCRCGVNFSWTLQQQLYRVSIGMEGCGGVLLAYPLSYKSVHDKFDWVCGEGHDNRVSFDSFIRGSRCRTCHNENNTGVNGYYHDRVDEVDTLYIISFKGDYLKVGRSFVVKERIYNLKRESGCKDIKVLATYTATHQEVYDTEQYIHAELEDRGFYHEESTWSTETFDLDSEKLIYHLLKETPLVKCDF